MSPTIHCSLPLFLCVSFLLGTNRALDDHFSHDTCHSIVFASLNFLDMAFYVLSLF